MTATHRLQQGLRALLAFSRPVDLHLARAHLSPALLRLFTQMRHSEQLHSLNVLRAVLAQGSTPPALATAALLHDVGKVRYPLFVWQKTLAVIIRAVSPALFDRWSMGSPRNMWMRPFVVSVRHPAWSGELLAQHNAPADAVWLAEHHQDPLERWADHPNAPLLRRLQAADEAN